MRDMYAPLHRHLSNLDALEWATTFREVEKILGPTLPPSARTYQEWWNPSDRTHTQALAWMIAGWEPAIINIRAETVVFRRTRSSAHRSNTPAIRPSRASAPSSSTNSQVPSEVASQTPVIPETAWNPSGQCRYANLRHLLRGNVSDKNRLPLDIHNLMQGLSW